MPSEVESRAIEEFRKTPIGHHSTDLQVILNEFRALPMEDKHCLICTKANREWQLAKTSGVRGKPVKVLKGASNWSCCLPGTALLSVP